MWQGSGEHSLASEVAAGVWSVLADGDENSLPSDVKEQLLRLGEKSATEPENLEERIASIQLSEAGERQEIRLREIKRLIENSRAVHAAAMAHSSVERAAAP